MTKKKAGIVSVALALAGAIGIGYVGASVACNSWNPVQWVHRAPTEITRPADDESKSWGKAVNTATGEVLKETETYAMPTGVMFMSERSESEIATAEFTAPTITFTAAINNKYLNIPLTLPESTEYLEVTPVNANTFTVKCLKPFGEKQKLTVTSALDSTVKLECEVDYLKRVFLFDDGGAYIGFNSGCEFNKPAKVYCEYQEALGTVKAEGYNLYAYLRLNDSYEAKFKSLLTFDIEFLTYELKLTPEELTERTNGDYKIMEGQSPELKYSYLIKDFDNYSEQQQNAIKYVWYVLNEESIDDEPDMIVTSVRLDYLYNGNVIHSNRRTSLDTNLKAPTTGTYTTWESGWYAACFCPEGEALAPIFTLTPDKDPIL